VQGLPPWMRSRSGSTPVLFIAPHGGLSERDLLEPPVVPARSNDIHTAGLAAELADRLDAGLLANEAFDRNRLDLNRVSDVLERAPWFLDAIAARIEAILAHAPVAEVVFIHGWHVVQAKCDVGVGARLADSAQAAGAASRLTVPPGYVTSRLEDLRAGCTRAGIATAYGERWPAAHRDNLMQLFRQQPVRERAGVAGRIAGWARSGRVCATQLELGAALRWPGPMRAHFVDAASAVWRDPSPGGRDVVSAPGRAVEVASEGRVDECGPAAFPPGLFLQAHDPGVGPGGLGIAAAMGVMAEDRLGARFLLLGGEREMVLFTGEEARRSRQRVGGLEMEGRPEGLRLRFHGPALRAADGGRHFRSEAEQVTARVVEVHAELDLATGHGGAFGELRGWVEVDGRRAEVHTWGFRSLPPVRSSEAPDAATTRVAASFGRDLGMALTFRSSDGAIEGQRFVPSGTEPLAGPARGCLRPPVRPPEPFSIPLASGRLTCHPRSHLSWLRPAGAGAYARVALGVASFSLDGRASGSGLYEHVERVGTPPGGEADPPRERGARA
jgi:hypothetical protein